MAQFPENSCRTRPDDASVSLFSECQKLFAAQQFTYTSSASCYPGNTVRLDRLMKSRVQLQAGATANSPRLYRGYGDAIVRIFREEGIRGFFKGLSASYWGVTEGALHFVVYERIKARLIAENRKRIARGDFLQSSRPPPNPEHLSSLQYLSAAAVSKLVASMATYPHEVVRLRMREQPKFVGALPKYRGMIQSLRLIAKEEGRKGLYAGMGTHLARVVPNAALMFFTYEVVVKWIERKQKREALHARSKAT